MAKGRSGFFARAEEKGSQLDRAGIDGKPVHGDLMEGTKIRYRDAMELWIEYCTKYNKDPVKDAYDLETLKDFMNGIVFGMQGCEGEYDLPSRKSVLQTWKDFTAQFRRKNNDAIPPNITLSVTNFTKERARIRGLPLFKRKRRYATSKHLIHLGEQLWEKDWYEYQCPGVRVSTWSEILDYSFISARIGEVVESTARANSGRGIHYRDIIFIVFRNEHGEPEFAAQLARDAKGMTWTPDKRPEQAIHEGSEPRPFFLNPILPKLAMWLARGAFRDYKTIDSVFGIPAPPEREVHQLHWDSSVLNKPLYDGSNGEIEKANSVSKRVDGIGRRANYPDPPTIHDFRAEGMHLVDSLYSASKRMGHGGHISETTHRKHYQPNNPGTDGQDAYLQGQLRTIVADVFRGMTVTRNPSLFQCLPAEKEHELETSPGFVSMKAELADLNKQPPSGERDRRRREIYAEKRKKQKKELRNLQESQPCERPWEANDELQSIGGYRSRFNRIRRLMPERDRLAESMFKIGCLRSPEGRQILEDMIALCKQKTEMAVRPGLEPDKCHCHDSSPPSLGKTDSKETSCSGRSSAARDWNHAYKCHKKYLSRTHGFGELCSLCDRWIVGVKEWEEHCQGHLDHPETIPVQCDLLIHSGIPAAAARCPVCLGDPSLSASERMRQFFRQDIWISHVTDCVEKMDRRSTAGCPVPWCTTSCEDVLKRRYHLQDIHCTPQIFIGIKRGLQDVAEDDAERVAPCKRQRRSASPRDLGSIGPSLPTAKYQFVDETIEVSMPQTSRQIHERRGAKPRGKQGKQTVTKRSKPLLASGDSTFSLVIRQPNAAEHPLRPVAPLEGPSSEASEISEPDLIWSGASVSRLSTSASSPAVETPRDDGDEAEDPELPSLKSLLKIGPSSRSPSSFNEGSEGLRAQILRIQGYAKASDLAKTPTLPAPSDPDPDVQILGSRDVRGKQQSATIVRDVPAVISDISSKPTSSRKRSPNNDYKCPRCGVKVSPPPRHRHRHMDASQKRAFCEAHRHKDELKAARLKWAKCGYPRIGWRKLDARVSKFLPALRGILDGEIPSLCLSQLKSVVASRADPRTRCMENAKAGYYGPRGQQIIMERILLEFKDEFPKRACRNRLLRQVGVADFVVTVLVPELVVMLIKEDMKVDDERAHEILQESERIGEILCADE